MTSPLIASTEKDPFKGAPSFSLSHRLLRIMWGMVWIVFASWTPAPLHRWRVFLLNLFGAKVHHSAHIYASAQVWYPPNLTMHAHACLAPHVNCYNMAPIVIGQNAIISQYAVLCAGTHDIKDPHFQLMVSPINIGAGAWVAAYAFVGPGVIVATDSVIGACAVVFKNTTEYGVYVGNPAKFIKMREIKNAK